MALTASLCLFLLLVMARRGASEERLLVSGYSDRVRSFTVQKAADGPVLRQDGEWAVDPNLTWLQLTDSLAYAIHEVLDFQGVPGGAVSRWLMAEDSWERQEWVSTMSPGPAHLLVNQEQGLAYVSNYGGGSLTVIKMQGEKLDKVLMVENFQGCRDKSHPHQVVSAGQWVWLVDLGCDVIRTYKAVDGVVTEVTKTEVQEGAGPRHLALHPTRPDLCFLACELKSLVQMYRVDQDTGSLELLQELELASGEEASWGAEILVQGDFIYASSRGKGVIVVYRLNSDDRMERIQELVVNGTWPRHMAFCPDGGLLVVLDQMGDSVQVLTVDRQTGLLTNGGVAATPPGPAFVSFY